MTTKNVKKEILNNLLSIPTDNLNIIRSKTFIRPLIKTMIRDSLLEDIILESDLSSELLESFLKKRNITETSKRLNFLNQNLLDEDDLKRLSSSQYKTNQISLRIFGEKAEDYFEKRKNNLDQYVYSLIQVKDENLAQELYLKLESNEKQFSEIALEHSVGPEKYKNGTIGPVPYSKLHPKIKDILINAEETIINEPINLDQFWIIIRLDEVIKPVFNEQMKGFLSMELFELFLERLTQEIIDEIKVNKFGDKFK